jgi:hypothetical protein
MSEIETVLIVGGGIAGPTLGVRSTAKVLQWS